MRVSYKYNKYRLQITSNVISYILYRNHCTMIKMITYLYISVHIITICIVYAEKKCYYARETFYKLVWSG